MFTKNLTRWRCRIVVSVIALAIALALGALYAQSRKARKDFERLRDHIHDLGVEGLSKEL